MTEDSRDCTLRVKPWGLVIKALMDGTIPFTYNYKPEQKLSKRLLVSEPDISKFLMDSTQKPAQEISGLSKFIPQKDALEILNCSGSSLGMLDGIDSQGINPKYYPLEKIIERADQCMATNDVAEHLGVDPAAMHAILTNARVIQVVSGGWHRAQAENLIARMTASRKAQFSLFASTSISIEVTGMPGFSRPDQSRKHVGCNGTPKFSAASSVSPQPSRQLSLKL